MQQYTSPLHLGVLVLLLCFAPYTSANPAKGKPHILQFKASPAAPQENTSFTATWQVKNATLCVLKGMGSVPCTGSKHIKIKRSALLELEASNENGKRSMGLQVLAQSPVPSILHFYADPLEIEAGQTTTLRWASKGASSIRLSPNSGQQGALPSSGTIVVKPQKSERYTLNIPGYPHSAETTVRLLEPTPFVKTWTVDSATIAKGEKVLLKWDITGVSNVAITGLPGILPPAGERSLALDKTTTLTLEARNERGAIRAEQMVAVVNPLPKWLVLKAFPEVFFAGEGGTITWEASDADEVILGDFGPKPPKGSLHIKPINDIALQATAKNAEGSTTQALRIPVRATTPSISLFTLAPEVIAEGGEVLVRWETSHATAVILRDPFDNSSDQVPSGQRRITVFRSGNISLTAQGPGGTTERHAAVTVLPGKPKVNIASTTISSTARKEAHNGQGMLKVGDRVSYKASLINSGTGIADHLLVSLQEPAGDAPSGVKNILIETPKTTLSPLFPGTVRTASLAFTINHNPCRSDRPDILAGFNLLLNVSYTDSAGGSPNTQPFAINELAYEPCLAFSPAYAIGGANQSDISFNPPPTSTSAGDSSFTLLLHNTGLRSAHHVTATIYPDKAAARFFRTKYPWTKDLPTISERETHAITAIPLYLAPGARAQRADIIVELLYHNAEGRTFASRSKVPLVFPAGSL